MQKRYVILALMPIFTVFILIVSGENSVCRSVSCMKKHYIVGEKLCYMTTDSFSLAIDPDKNGLFAKRYFSIKYIFAPQEKTIIRREDFKTVGLLNVEDLFPFEKDTSDRFDGCVLVE